jgi:hypothetical protein
MNMRSWNKHVKESSFILCRRSKDEVERLVKRWSIGPACWEDLEIIRGMLKRARTPEQWGAVYVWYSKRMESRLTFKNKCWRIQQSKK